MRQFQRLLVDFTTGHSSDCVRLRSTTVRATRLENRQGFTAFVSSNLTLSANDALLDQVTGLCSEPSSPMSAFMSPQLPSDGDSVTLHQILLVIVGAEAVLRTEITWLRWRGPATGRLMTWTPPAPTASVVPD